MAATRLLRAATTACLFATAAAYNNGVAAKPPMGWNSWCTDSLCNLFGDDPCSDKLVREMTDAMVDQGMKDLGYNYVMLDDCWSASTRDASGQLQADSAKFPNGIKPVADYVHSKGMNFGLYTCVGTETCKGHRPGSYGNWTKDANTLASWGVDFVKMDHCSAPHNIPDHELYGNMSLALNKTGRPILFSLCNWGNEQVWEWGAQVAQMYRVQMDHLPFWHINTGASGVGLGQGTADIIEFMAQLVPSRWVQRWGWLDPDFLMTLYWPTMTFVESRTEYTFWALWSSPLFVSTDVRRMSSDMRSILMNPEVVAVNQDALATAGDRVRGVSGGVQVWSRDLANGDKAVVLFNSGKAPAEAGVTWAELNATASSRHAVRDLWKRVDVGTFAGGFNASSPLAPKDVLFIRVAPVTAGGSSAP